MRTLGGMLRKIWHNSPNETWIKCRRRGRQLFGRSDFGWNYSLESVLANPKHMNSKMEMERWERHWRVCRLHGSGNIEPNFEFDGKNVMELGCGPVLGCGPFALFHGANSFWYREPDLVRQALESRQIKEKYFVPMYEELVSNYGRKMAIDDWYPRVIELSKPLPTGSEKIVDITVSHSVLEHIPIEDLAAILKDLHLASRSDGWFSHTVDFGPHGGRLSDVYSKDRHDKPRHLNHLRKSEIERLLKDSGFDLSASVIYKSDEIEQDAVHNSWKTYSGEDLSTRVMIFIGKQTTTSRQVN